MSQIEKNLSASLRMFNFKNTYDSYEDDPFGEFLIPALDRSLIYNRAVGYFSSAILGVVPEAFTNFAEKGGKIKIICSPHLTPRDADAFLEINNESILNKLNSEIQNYLDDGLLKEPIQLLKVLLHLKCLEIKFAIPHDQHAGIFHQKIGVFEDSNSNYLSFSGSNNESISGWLEMKNADRFTVSRGWSNQEYELDIAQSTKNSFERMWRNNYHGFEIVDFTEKLDFITRQNNEDTELESIKKSVVEWVNKRIDKKSSPAKLFLRGYQTEVINNWIKNDYVGVISFATGAGKTFTALNAAKKWIEMEPKRALLVLVPSETLQKQWIREIRKIEGFSESDILTVGGGTSPDLWTKALSGYTSFTKSDHPRIVVAVIDSAATHKFIDRVQWGNQLMVIADEMHNLGAPSFTELLNAMNVGAKLGLSATPERYEDDENKFLRSIFGEDLKPIIDIGAAQELGVLVPYRYRFKTVRLTEDEKENYDEVSNKISKLIAINKNKEDIDDRYLKTLKIQRADILKNAKLKISEAELIIRQEYKKDSSWLIFCNDSKQLNELKVKLKDFEPLEYHQKMEGDLKATLKYFQRHGGIMISIDMLSEGVDIPSIDHCLLVASSQSMREYIQRRGRVLRKNPNKAKAFAEIWDLIVVNEMNNAINPAEIIRASEFAKFALNSSVTSELDKLKLLEEVLPQEMEFTNVR